MNIAKKLKKHGKGISVVEVTAVTQNGIWMLYDEAEYFLSFKKFPWFKKATIEQIQDVEVQGSCVIHWPLIDVDLDLNRIEHPDRYPLVSRIS